MGFLDYYTESSDINEYADGSSLAAMVGDIGRKKDKQSKSTDTIGVPKNVWHMPKWESGYAELKKNIEAIQAELEAIPETGEISQPAPDVVVTDPQETSIRDRFLNSAQIILNFVKIFMEYRKLEKEDAVNTFPKLRENMIKFKDALKKFTVGYKSDLATLPYDAQQRLLALHKAFREVVDTDYKALLVHLKDYVQILSHNKTEPEPETEPELTPAEQEFMDKQTKELSQKEEPKAEPEFIEDNPKDLPKVSSSDKNVKVIKGKPGAQTDAPKLTPEQIKKVLLQNAKDKKDAKKKQQASKPLSKVAISPEKRQAIADKRIKRKLTDSYRYGFLEHYDILDEHAQLQMNLNEESPYLLNRIMGNVAGAMGKGLKGVAGLAMGALKSKLFGKVKTQKVNGEIITKYSGRGRFFNVPYSGYVAANAACAQSLTEYMTLVKQQGMLVAKTTSLKFSMVTGRINLEINPVIDENGETNEDILPIIKSLGFTPPNGVNSIIVIESTLWKTSNGGNVIAMSTLANPDEEDQETASTKANTAVVIDADERSDMLFFVGCDTKGEKFFVDNFSMSFRQYLQSVKTASNATISKQASMMGSKFDHLLNATETVNTVQKIFTDSNAFEKAVKALKLWAQGENIAGETSNPTSTQKILQYKVGNGVIKAMTDGNKMIIQSTPELIAKFDPNGVNSYR